MLQLNYMYWDAKELHVAFIAFKKLCKLNLVVHAFLEGAKSEKEM